MLNITIDDYNDVSSHTLIAPIPNLKFNNMHDKMVHVRVNGDYVITLLPLATQFALRNFYLGDSLCFYEADMETGQHLILTDRFKRNITIQ